MIKLDPFQEEILNYEGDLVLCTGRQIGKTTIMAIKAGKRMRERPGTKIIIVSLTEDQAKLIISMILQYLEQTAKHEIAKGANKPTQNKVMLKNKSFALARPVGNTGDAVRGFTGDVLIIDEASRMPEAVFTAAEPTLLTTGGELWICSTPFGKQGYFYRCFENKEGLFKVIHKSSEDVIYNREISDEWTAEKREKAIKRLEQQKQIMSRNAYGQEYLGLFLDDLRQFFSDELIERVCCIKRPNDLPEGKNYLGCDLARMGDDESSFEVINEKNGIYLQIENITTSKTLTTETEQRIIEISERFNCKKVGIDAGAGSLGVSILDHLLETKLRNKVIALNNRSMSLDPDGKKKQRLLKEDMYNNLKAMLEKRELLLLDDDKIKMSLKSIQYEYIITSHKISTLRIFGADSHATEGLIRAAWIAKKEKTLNLWAY